MVIEINKDIDRYQESVAMGLTAKQLLFSVASVVIGGGLVLLLYKHVGLTVAAYIAVPVVAPIALGGFYSFNGMGFYEYMGKKLHFMFGNKALVHVSTENETVIHEWDAQNASTAKGKAAKQTEGTGKNGEEFEAMKKKMKNTLIVSVVGIIALIIGAIVYKNMR